MCITFLGIGLMGDPMARRLLAAGYEVTVWNRTAAKAQALAGVGARPVAQLADAVGGADIVISMLEAGPVVGQVLADALPSLLAVRFPELPLPVVMFVAVAIGLALGLINGYLIGYLDLAPIVVTLGTMSVYRGLVFVLSGGAWVSSHQMPADFSNGLSRVRTTSSS